MHQPMRFVGTLAVTLLAATAVRAQYSDDVATLKSKVQLLEKKVAALETEIASLQPLRREYEQRQADRKEAGQFGGTPGPIESTHRPVVGENSETSSVRRRDWNH